MESSLGHVLPQMNQQMSKSRWYTSPLLAHACLWTLRRNRHHLPQTVFCEATHGVTISFDPASIL